MYRVALKSCSISSRRRLTTTSTTTTHRRWFADTTITTPPPPPGTTTAKAASPSSPKLGSGPMEFKNAAEKHEYLKAANAEMERYHHAREMMRQGKLTGRDGRNTGGPRTESGNVSTGLAQLGVVTLFMIAFMATPLLGKRIARDEEFRNRWVPAWYDFTVPKPDKPWTREELHEQMIAVQREIRERAIRGDFSPEKLQELQENLEGQVTDHQQRQRRLNQMPPGMVVRKEWERIHPGVEDGEEVNED